MTARKSVSEKVPSSMRETFDAIVKLTDAFSADHLDEEYAQLARQAAAALCRKRPSPLVNGKPQSWACGIIHALGLVNFLFDRSQTPTMSAGELYKAFGLSQATGAAKSKAVRNALDMIAMDPKWTRPSKLADNPVAWMLEVNGFVVDARYLPVEVQELAYAKGLIPYVPSKGREEE